MSNYPLARWSQRGAIMGASVHTQPVPDAPGAPGAGGGYYTYTWSHGSPVIAVAELISSPGRERRQFPFGERSTYAHIVDIPVTPDVLMMRGEQQIIAVGRIMYDDMTDRFGPIAEWITYGSDGKQVAFHDAVVGGQ